MNNNMNNEFYMIFVEGSNSPTFRHEKYADALVEAKRLSRNLKAKAYILMSVVEVELNEFNIKKIVDNFDCDDSLPF